MTCFISKWSLCGLLKWPFDNHGADRDGNAESISRAMRVRFDFVPRVNGPTVPSGTVLPGDSSGKGR
jgi:hypothetical protein